MYSLKKLVGSVYFLNLLFVKMFDYKQMLYIYFFIIQSIINLLIFLFLICLHILPFLIHFLYHLEKKAHLTRSPQ